MNDWSNLQPPIGLQQQAAESTASAAVAARHADACGAQQPWPQPQPFAPQPTPAQDRDALLMRWQDARDALAVAKINEIKLRTEVFSSCFPKPIEGTNTLELGNGYELKAVFKVNYSLVSDVDKVEAALRAIASVDNEGPFIAERLVKWSAELSLSEYRELAPKYKAHIDTVLTTKPGTPSLEIKPPKK